MLEILRCWDCIVWRISSERLSQLLLVSSIPSRRFRIEKCCGEVWVVAVDFSGQVGTFLL